MPSLQFCHYGSNEPTLASQFEWSVNTFKCLKKIKKREKTGQNNCGELNLAIFVGTYSLLFYLTCSVPCINVGDVAQW
jgi:hypothetical protein